jgi:hypothetical protein
MNPRRVSHHRHASSALPEPRVADSAALVAIESSTHRDTRSEVANQDAVVQTRAQIVNPLWMVTAGLAVLLGLLAIFSVSG